MTVPVPLLRCTLLGSAHKHIWIHTRSISAAHKVVLTSYNIGGVGGWNVDLAYYPSIMLHTAKYRCKNSTQESPIPMKQHKTACCWPSASDELGSCETRFTRAMKIALTHEHEVCAVCKTLSTDSTPNASPENKESHRITSIRELLILC